MTIKEAESLKKGTEVYTNEGNGYICRYKFIRAQKAEVFKGCTFSDLVTGDFLKKGKKEWHGLVEDSKGKTHSISLRRLHREV